MGVVNVVSFLRIQIAKQPQPFEALESGLSLDLKFPR